MHPFFQREKESTEERERKEQKDGIQKCTYFIKSFILILLVGNYVQLLASPNYSWQPF